MQTPPPGHVATRGQRGPAGVLVRLVAKGLDPAAVPAAAALVAMLDADAIDRAEERRERARLGGLARQARRRSAA